MLNPDTMMPTSNDSLLPSPLSCAGCLKAVISVSVHVRNLITVGQKCMLPQDCGCFLNTFWELLSSSLV